VKKKILVVDDSDPLRRAICEALSLKFQCEIHEAQNGLEGLVKAKQVSPDVILLDYNLPGLDGSQVLQRLRIESELLHSRVLIMTASNDKETVKLFASLGVSGYIVKPFLFDDLLTRVEKILNNNEKSNFR
jgi:two-component system cell cycle response regulator